MIGFDVFPPELLVMATVLVLAFVAIPLVLTVALTPLALALFPRFRSREIKRGAHQLTSAARPSSRLPLVGGPVLALALTAGAILHPDAPLWPLAAVGGFFAFGLLDDLTKTLRGRGIGAGVYFAVNILLSIVAVALIVGRGERAVGDLDALRAGNLRRNRRAVAPRRLVSGPDPGNNLGRRLQRRHGRSHGGLGHDFDDRTLAGRPAP